MSAARAILANEVALPQGCVRIAKILYWLRPVATVDYPIIHEYLQAVEATGAPLGSDRLLWERQRLAERDVALWDVTERYRPAIVEACWNIIDEFGDASASPHA
ncbi:MAG TPA: hypothetical protein VF846_01030 [Thermoanaerobaculia bacterium]